MNDRIVRALGAAYRIATSVARTGSFAYVRLYLAGRRQPFKQPGSFQLPFGCVEYTTIGSLTFTYYEIFVEQIYDARGLGPRPRIIDCGSNIGLSVIWFKQRYPDSTVLAFEADPAISALMARNIKRLALNSVEIVHSAVSGDAGSKSFLAEGSIGGRLVSAPSVKSVDVKTVRLSDYIDGPVDLLKLDVEGAEFDVLEDLCATGKIELVRNLICEVHRIGPSPAPIGDFLQRLGQCKFAVCVAYADSTSDARNVSSTSPFQQVRNENYRMLLYAWRSHTASGGVLDGV